MYVPLFVPPRHLIVRFLLFGSHQLPGKGELPSHSTHAEAGILLLQFGTFLRAEVQECTPAKLKGKIKFARQGTSIAGTGQHIVGRQALEL